LIAFSCSCGQKFQVKDDCAGRKATCPTCKQPLVVPAPDKTQAYIPTGQIDGTPSSIAQAGLEGGVTLDQAARPGQKPVQELLARQTKKGERYIIEGEIARGGMGAVLRAVDCDIRREVAVKYLLDQSDPRKKSRFIEEAQITGQLEHPNIPPVHELGVDKEKHLFFSMKMVKGRSLAQVLDELRQNPKTAERDYTLSRLLNILVNVCNGLAYVHSRGVVHRDLKPANIMVGDFGEVYVMDWGLAKVLKGGQASELPQPAASVQPSQSVSGKRSSKVETSREGEADLTQEGSVLGTPVYMPKEQATGNLQAINERSDIYSLGAILYELLTLQPPVDKEGGYLAILMRVMEGQIESPEVRTPKRAKAGKIPRELSAIAMKALSKNPQDRYQSVESLRQDIERYQEGRSVSAKLDTFKEMAWKLVKRNKGASATAAVGLLVLVLVLGIGFIAINNARLRAEDNYSAYLKEQESKHQQARESVPAYLRAAHQAVNDREFPDALIQVNTALEYQADHAEARLLKGQLLIVQQQFSAAAEELDKCLNLRPNEQVAWRLRKICRTAKRDDLATQLAFATEFTEQNAFPLADGMLSQSGANAVEARPQLLILFQKRIEAAWPGLGSRLKMDSAGKFQLGFKECKQVTDLGPLKGMPLTSLDLFGCGQVRDLTPLQGMKLTQLTLGGCGEVRDLTPLKGMPLTYLNLGGCRQVRDLTPLKDMPLTSLRLDSCVEVWELTPLQGMPLINLSLNRCEQVADLAPLKGMKLTSLDLFGCGGVRDLTPLKDVPLTVLNLADCRQVRDLTPLKDMPLTSLRLGGCVEVSDLTPLKGLKLTELRLMPKNITKGMEVVRQMKSLKKIFVEDKEVALEDFWKKLDAGEFK
jgi:serine/threonine protein kinase